MLRRLVLWLLVANMGYWAWAQGWLAALGPWAAPAVQREPQRLQRQIDPNGITLLPSATATATATTLPPATTTAPEPAGAGEPEASAAAPAAQVAPGGAAGDAPAAATTDTTTALAPASAAAPAPAPAADTGPRQCLQLGALTEKQADAIKPVLDKALPSGSWQMEASVQPPRWVVYIGRLPNADTLVSRRVELRQLRVDFRDVTVPGLPPGLALGTYSLESSAQQALTDLIRKGVKGAKVAVERTETTLYMARMPKVTVAQRRAAAQALATAGSAWGGKTLQPCP